MNSFGRHTYSLTAVVVFTVAAVAVFTYFLTLSLVQRFSNIVSVPLFHSVSSSFLCPGEKAIRIIGRTNASPQLFLSFQLVLIFLNWKIILIIHLLLKLVYVIRLTTAAVSPCSILSPPLSIADHHRIYSDCVQYLIGFDCVFKWAIYNLILNFVLLFPPPSSPSPSLSLVGSFFFYVYVMN